MILQNIPTFEAKAFSYYGIDKKFVTELSDLLGGTNRPFMSNIYDDAADVGLRIRSHTGREEIFHLTDVIRDADGDITVWIFKPINTKSLRLRGVTVHILND